MPAATPPEPNHAQRTLAALESIAKDTREVRELLTSFTSDGWPLRSQMPGAEFSASMTAALVVLLRDQALTHEDIVQRIMAAQKIAKELIRQHDAFTAATAISNLDELAKL